MIDLVDFHSHILPGADHGSASVSESLEQIKLASARGIKRIIATPHFYPDSHSVDSFIKQRDSAYSDLLAALPSDSPRIVLGAEVLVCDGIENMPDLARLFIQGTRTLLLEMSSPILRHTSVNSVSRLVSSGVDVVLAHAERYLPSGINQLIEAGARIQLNADSLKPLFINKNIKNWLEQGKVVALGSDIHGPNQRAYRNFEIAISRLSGYIGYIKQESDLIWNMAEGCGLNS